MTGLAGGPLSEGTLERMTDAFWSEPWYGDEVLSADGLVVGQRHHGDRDPKGHVTWRDGKRGGAVHGAITDWNGLDVPAFFDRVLSDPTEVLPQVDGPFAVAAFDADARRVVLATDKLGSRQVFYTTDRFAFATRLAALLPVLEDTTVDEQAISDMLLLGHMWGDRTLLTDTSALYPATALVWDDGDVTTNRYWEPTYDLAEPGEDYLFELAKRFQRSADRTASSLPATAGLWLSGGLDSRITSSELARNAGRAGQFDRLITYTYDSNPPGGVNPRLASRVADSLAVENVRVDHSPEEFADRLEDVVRATDGMVQWNTLFNLAAAFDLPDPSAPVIMEGLEGSLLGRHLNPIHFECDSIAESTYRSEAKRDKETVSRLLDVDAEPLATLREAGDRLQQPTFAGNVMDAHFQNYYARMALASNAVPRTQVGTRIPYADGPFLEQAARMPLAYREKTFPLTDGTVPYGITRPKLVMMRLLNDDLASIPYEKTRLPPSYPFLTHVAGFVGTTAWNRLRSTYTYGGPSRLDDWYREDDTFRRFLDGYVDDLCDRSFVDADAVRDLQREHHAEEGHHVGTLAPLTTVEIWLQEVVESVTHQRPVATGDGM